MHINPSVRYIYYIKFYYKSKKPNKYNNLLNEEKYMEDEVHTNAKLDREEVIPYFMKELNKRFREVRVREVTYLREDKSR